MIARTLDLHPHVVAHHEPDPPLNLEAYLKWSQRKSRAWIARRLARKRMALVERAQRGGLQFVESSHWLSHLIAELDQVFEGRFVFLHRDGRQFVRSGLERDWYRPLSASARLKTSMRRVSGVPIGNTSRDHRLDPPAQLHGRLVKIAWLWAEINGAVLEQLRAVPADRVFRLGVEDLDADRLTRLLQFIGVEAEGEWSEAMLSLAGGRPNRTEAFQGEAGELWEADNVALFDSVAGEMMRALGYYEPASPTS